VRRFTSSSRARPHTLTRTHAFARTHAHARPMNLSYYFRQYIGFTLAVLSFAGVAFAGVSERDYGIPTNTVLYASVGACLVGLAFHECRPFQRKARMTFSKEEHDQEWAAFKAEVAAAQAEADGKKTD